MDLKAVVTTFSTVQELSGLLGTLVKLPGRVEALSKVVMKAYIPLRIIVATLVQKQAIAVEVTAAAVLHSGDTA